MEKGPVEHKCPTRGPSREIRGGSKDELGIMTVARASYRTGNNGREDEDEIHAHKSSLQFAHRLAERACDHAMVQDAAEEYSVGDAVRGLPVAIFSDDHHAEQHE